MVILAQTNPWTETNQTSRARQATVEVSRAATAARTFADGIPNLADRLTHFADCLERISIAYAADPAAYRRTRALTAVHLPAIMESLDALRDLGKTTEPERVETLTGDLSTCLFAADHALAAIEDDRFDAAALEAATAAASLPSVAREGKDPSNGNSWLSASRSAFEGASRRITAAGRDLAARAGAGRDLATGVLSDLYEDGLDAVSSPVSTRLVAARRAFEGASISAIVGGCLLAIVFPPAAPLALGLAALEAPDIYAESLEQETARARAARLARRTEREERTARSLAALRGTSPIIRVETPCLHVTIDLSTGNADGLVLAGCNTGRMLADIDPGELDLMLQTAPDERTAEVLRSWIKRTSV